MAWIPMIPEDEADGELAELYRRYRDPRWGGVDHILRIHSLNPASLEAHVAVYRSAMHGPSPLSSAQREMIAVAVSAVNACHY